MIIREGTENVRGGNCIIDADVWVPKGKRKDIETFESLYGVLPENFRRFMACEGTVKVVNKHAGIIASKSQVVPTAEFHEYWNCVPLGRLRWLTLMKKSQTRK